MPGVPAGTRPIGTAPSWRGAPRVCTAPGHSPGEPGRGTPTSGHLPSGMMTRLGCLEAKFCNSCNRGDCVGTRGRRGCSEAQPFPGKAHVAPAPSLHRLAPSTLLQLPCSRRMGLRASRMHHMPLSPPHIPCTAGPTAVPSRLPCAAGARLLLEPFANPFPAPTCCPGTECSRPPAQPTASQPSLTCARCPLGSRQAAKTHSGGFGIPRNCRTSPRPIPRLAPVTRTERMRSSPILLLLPLLQLVLFAQLPNASL